MSSTNTKAFLSRLGPFFGLLLLIIVITAMNPSFLTASNILNVLRQVSISALIAFGMTFVILTRGIDLSVGDAGVFHERSAVCRHRKSDRSF